MKKRSKMPKQMGETIGIDLGDKVSRYCIVDRDGDVVEEGSFRNQVGSIEKHFGDRPRRIALEAGAQSAWISRELKRLGHEVIVANPRELKWITSSDTKNDPVDARKLALLARAEVRLLAPVEHRSAAQQTDLRDRPLSQTCASVPCANSGDYSWSRSSVPNRPRSRTPPNAIFRPHHRRIAKPH
jgi:transposase